MWQVLAGTTVLLLCGWAYWPTLVRIAQTWAQDPDYSHGYLVVPLSVFLLWLRAAQRPPMRLGFHPAGMVLLLLAAALRYLSGRLYLRELDAWSIPLWLGGVCWTLYGWKIARWAAPSIGFLWFATPLPGTATIVLSIPLQKVAAQCSGIALQLFGQPAIVEGTTILLGDQTLEVERACSGLRMFYGVTALGFAIILITRPGFWKSIGILAVVAPVAILVNTFRITIMGLMMTRYSSETIRRVTHDLAGVFIIPVALVTFLGLLWLVGRISQSWRKDPGQTTKWLLSSGVACVLLIVAAAWWYGIQRERAFVTLLATADRYEAQDDWTNAVKYLNRYVLARPDDTAQRVHLAETYAKAATTPSTRVRAAQLLREAFQAQPQRQDLAIQAIDLAVQTGNYRLALDFLDDLQESASAETDLELAEKQADVLLGYLSSAGGATQTERSWQDVAAVLEKVVRREGHATKYVLALALVTREHLTVPDAKERAARADSLINQLVIDRVDDPEAWLARYRYAKLYWADDDPQSADDDLDRALDRCSAGPPETQVDILLAAAERSRQNGSTEQARQYLQRAITAHPKAVAPYLALADIEQQSGEPQAAGAAIAILRQGLQASDSRGLQATDSQSLKLKLALAQALAKSGDDTEVAILLDPLRALLPRVVDGAEKSQLALAIANVESIQQQQRGQVLKAAATLEKALQDPDAGVAADYSRQLGQAWQRLGQLYVSLGRLDQAVQANQRAVRFNPASTVARQALADTALAAGDVELAVRENLRRTKQQPEAGAAWVALAVAQLRQQLQLPPGRRNLSKVKRSLDRAGRLPTPKVPLLLASVDLLRAENRADEARQLLEKLLAEDAEQPDLWRTLVTVHLELGETEPALAAAVQVAAHGGDPLETIAMRVSILAALGRTEEAVGLVDELQTESSEQRSLETALLAAALQRQLERYPEARSILEQACRAHPDEVAPLETLARYAWQDQDWQQLAQCENRLKQLEGPAGTQWKAYRVIRLLANGQRLDEAAITEVAELTRQISVVRPRWATSEYLLAQVALRRGNTDEAIRHFESAWRLGERSATVAEQLLALLNQAGRADDADRYAAGLGTMPLTSPGLFDRLLPSLLEQGQGGEALVQARKWVQDDPQDVQALLRLARTLLVRASKEPEGADRTRQLSEAEHVFRQAVQLAPTDVTTWSSLLGILLADGQA